MNNPTVLTDTPAAYGRPTTATAATPAFDAGPAGAYSLPRASRPGLCWQAVIGGALATSALSLILLMLGTGLGFSAVSPWAHDGASARTMSVMTVVWISLMSLVASGLGGYLAGRLRGHDPLVSPDEQHFRDTANGFLSWALATLLTAALLTSAIGALVGGATDAGASAASMHNNAAMRGDGAMNQNQNPGMGSTFGTVTAADDRAPATRQEDDVRARQAADEARKAASHAAYWTFFSLLLGAFAASVAGLLGGRHTSRYAGRPADATTYPTRPARA